MENMSEKDVSKQYKLTRINNTRHWIGLNWIAGLTKANLSLFRKIGSGKTERGGNTVG